MSEVEFKKFAICDTCGVETLCREDGEDDQCGGCYWAPINHAKHQAELAALREELASADRSAETLHEVIGRLKSERDEAQQRLTAAEQRNAESSAAMQLATRLLASGLSALNPRAGLAKNVRAFLESQRKPTESGVSEYVKSCEVAHEALKMENQRITPARFKCLACGDYHEGSGNLPCPKMRPMSGASE